MATWHQKRAGLEPAASRTEWLVVVDPPGSLRWIWGASSREAAEDYLQRVTATVGAHAWIVPPAALPRTSVPTVKGKRA